MMQGYTSAGVGTSGVPVRFFCRPEIGLIELRCPRHEQDHPTCTSSAPTGSRPKMAPPSQARRPTTLGIDGYVRTRPKTREAILWDKA